jgi:NADH:ubiquinone oxidoreductase subunit F (NADH-binding)
MNFEEIYAAAAATAGYLLDDRYAKVCVSGAGPAGRIADSLQKGLGRGLNARVVRAGSMGYFDLETVLLIEKAGGGIMYRNVTADNAPGLVEDYLARGIARPDMALGSFGSDSLEGVPRSAEVRLFSLQKRLALRNCGYIDPGEIDHYLVRGKGYAGLARSLRMGPAEVIGALRRSGLRDHAGEGRSTADRWQECRNAAGIDKYFVCNAIDADPRSMTARLLLGSDPHGVLEGLLIGAYAVGASRCFICVDSENKAGLETLGKAAGQMERYSLLGRNILGSDFNVEIEIREITGGLVAGEETALLRALEGQQALPCLTAGPAPRRGYNGRPAVVDDTETLAGVSGIFQNGPEWLSATGAGESRGTKIVTVTDGKKQLTVEAPFGTTLRTLVTDIAGHRDVGAVQFGGPTGAFFSTAGLDTPVTYEAMQAAGSVIGPGTATVFGEGTCPVAAAQQAVSFLQAQSCGQCVFCREGTLQMADILADIAGFKGRPGDLEMIEELGGFMQGGCICAIGNAAAYPVLSSLRLFRADFEAHLDEKRCLAAGQGSRRQG